MKTLIIRPWTNPQVKSFDVDYDSVDDTFTMTREDDHWRCTGKGFINHVAKAHHYTDAELEEWAIDERTFGNPTFY